MADIPASVDALIDLPENAIEDQTTEDEENVVVAMGQGSGGVHIQQLLRAGRGGGGRPLCRCGAGALRTRA